MSAPTLDRKTILRAIEDWPLHEQVDLADAILNQAFAHTAAENQASAHSLMALRGIAATDQPAPSDEDVARMLEEERLRKYGE